MSSGAGAGGSRRAGVFPIPMRGNELPIPPSIPSAPKFPIPMRGNEIHGATLARGAARRFPIPMRGNEVEADEIVMGDVSEVSDPHEG